MKKMKYQNSKRYFSFFSSVIPLTSKRVRILLSDPSDSKDLAKVIRDNRKGIKDASFLPKAELEYIE